MFMSRVNAGGLASTAASKIRILMLRLGFGLHPFDGLLQADLSRVLPPKSMNELGIQGI